jgi:hypothetical protein
MAFRVYLKTTIIYQNSMVEKYLYVKWNGVKRQAVAKTPKVDHSSTQQQG